jgi:hypothetical protein
MTVEGVVLNALAALCRLIFVIDASMQWDCAFGD